MTTKTLNPESLSLINSLSIENIPSGVRVEWLSPFKTTADKMLEVARQYNRENHPELVVALRKLVECRDAAIRAYTSDVQAKIGTTFE